MSDFTLRWLQNPPLGSVPVSNSYPLPVDIISGTVTASFAEAFLNVTGAATSAAVLFTQASTIGYYSCFLQIGGTGGVNSVVVEVNNNGTWVPVVVEDVSNPGPLAVITTDGVFRAITGGLAFRARVSVFGSGTVTANAEFRGFPITQPTFQALQPVSVTTLPLPSGAATSALQSSVGATAHTDAAAINTTLGAPFQAGGDIGNTSFGATQSGAWSVTANAGTNLNTSALALETGGNLATLAGGVSSSVYQENLKQVNGVTVLTGAGATGTGSQRVTVAGDSNTVAGSSSIPAGTNLIGKAGIDQTTIGTTNGVALVAINSTTALVGNGISGAGSLRVNLASDNSALPAAGQGATAAAVPAGATYDGLQARTSNPSAASNGNLVGASADKLGRQVVVIGQVRDLKGNQYTTLSSSSETTVVTAVSAIFLDIYGCIAANTTASAVTLVFKDSTSGTTQFELYVPANDTRGFMLPSSDAFKQTTVNNNWTCTGGASGVNITMLYVQNT